MCEFAIELRDYRSNKRLPAKHIGCPEHQLVRPTAVEPVTLGFGITAYAW